MAEKDRLYIRISEFEDFRDYLDKELRHPSIEDHALLLGKLFDDFKTLVEAYRRLEDAFFDFNFVDRKDHQHTEFCGKEIALVEITDPDSH